MIRLLRFLRDTLISAAYALAGTADQIADYLDPDPEYEQPDAAVDRFTALHVSLWEDELEDRMGR